MQKQDLSIKTVYFKSFLRLVSRNNPLDNKIVSHKIPKNFQQTDLSKIALKWALYQVDINWRFLDAAEEARHVLVLKQYIYLL